MRKRYRAGRLNIDAIKERERNKFTVFSIEIPFGGFNRAIGAGWHEEHRKNDEACLNLLVAQRGLSLKENNWLGQPGYDNGVTIPSDSVFPLARDKDCFVKDIGFSFGVKILKSDNLWRVYTPYLWGYFCIYPNKLNTSSILRQKQDLVRDLIEHINDKRFVHKTQNVYRNLLIKASGYYRDFDSIFGDIWEINGRVSGGCSYSKASFLMLVTRLLNFSDILLTDQRAAGWELLTACYQFQEIVTKVRPLLKWSKGRPKYRVIRKRHEECRKVIIKEVILMLSEDYRRIVLEEVKQRKRVRLIPRCPKDAVEDFLIKSYESLVKEVCRRKLHVSQCRVCESPFFHENQRKIYCTRYCYHKSHNERRRNPKLPIQLKTK